MFTFYQLAHFLERNGLYTCKVRCISQLHPLTLLPRRKSRSWWSWSKWMTCKQIWYAYRFLQGLGLSGIVLCISTCYRIHENHAISIWPMYRVKPQRAIHKRASDAIWAFSILTWYKLNVLFGLSIPPLILSCTTNNTRGYPQVSLIPSESKLLQW